MSSFSKYKATKVKMFGNEMEKEKAKKDYHIPDNLTNRKNKGSLRNPRKIRKVQDKI